MPPESPLKCLWNDCGSYMDSAIELTQGAFPFLPITKLKQKIKTLFGKADIVLLDAAPGLGREATSAMRAADEILYVMTPFVPPMMDIIKCNAVANELNLKPLGVVMNMTGEGRYEVKPEEVEQLVELPVISNIPRDKDVLRSLAAKRSLDPSLSLSLSSVLPGSSHP